MFRGFSTEHMGSQLPIQGLNINTHPYLRQQSLYHWTSREIPFSKLLTGFLLSKECSLCPFT